MLSLEHEFIKDLVQTLIHLIVYLTNIQKLYFDVYTKLLTVARIRNKCNTLSLNQFNSIFRTLFILKNISNTII